MEKKALMGLIVIVVILAAGATYWWFTRPTGPTISFKIYYNTGNVQREQLASLLASEWGKLGFKVTVQGLEWPVLLDKILNPEEFDVYIIGWAPDYVDPDNYAHPMSYGGTQFSDLKIFEVTSASDISNHLKNAWVYPVEDDWYVVAGEKGTGATVSIPAGKKILVVQYEVDAEATLPLNESVPWVHINPGMYRNATADALIVAGVKATNPAWRKAIYNAVQQYTNQELPLLWIGQALFLHGQWTWVYGWYYHPVMDVRYDMMWENASAPDVEIGTLGGGIAGTPQMTYENNESVISIATFGWPESLDPAATYETFGWELLWETGDTLVTYWKEEADYVSKDLAIAWAYTPNGTDYYFVIRGGVQAFNRWVDKITNATQELYNISAIDVLFSIWRIDRLGMDPSWMVSSYIDTNSSEVLTESEFDALLQSGELTTDYRGVTHDPTSLNDLLTFFGSAGEDTAGVVHIKLYEPYPAILPILADAFTTVIPMKYVFDAWTWDYDAAVTASNNGKDPSAWADWINGTLGDNEPSHVLLHKYPVTTGPFYIYDYLENQWIILKQNPYYWNSTLYEENPNYGTIKYVIYSIQSETEPRLALYTSGAADFCAVPLDRVEDVNGTTLDSFQIIEEKDPNLLTYNIIFVVWNTYKFPFNNSLVRKALAYATPYEKIYSQVYSDFVVPLYGVIPQGMFGWTDTGIIHYQYDMTKAKELIEASGIFGSKTTTSFIIPPLFLALPPALRREDE
jgi:peptide/nickel transport system substrate-binding protein